MSILELSKSGLHSSEFGHVMFYCYLSGSQFFGGRGGGQGNQQETSVIKNTPKVNLKEYYSGYSYKWVFSFFILELYHRLRISDIVYLFS